MRYTMMRKKEGDKEFTSTAEIYDDEMEYPLNAKPEQIAYANRLSLIRAQDRLKLYTEGDVAFKGPDGKIHLPTDKKVQMEPDIVKAMMESEGGETEEEKKTRAQRLAGPEKRTPEGEKRLKSAAETGTTNAARTAAKVPGAAQPAAEPKNPMGPNFNPSGTGPIKGRTAPPWTKE